MSAPLASEVPPSSNSVRPSAGLETIRRQLLTSLHMGKLSPGDRVPSVRSMARITGLNRKTVHRAYLKLADEGLLDLRWGSGTYFAEDPELSPDGTNVSALLDILARFRSDAELQGVSAELLPSLLARLAPGGLSGIRVVVVECNGEQRGLIAKDLRERVGVEATELPLSELDEAAKGLGDSFAGIVTTDCHRAQVEGVFSGSGVPVYRIALEPSLPERMARAARRGPVVMIVRDEAFAGPFDRLLEQMKFPPELRERVRVVEPRHLGRDLGSGSSETSVYVSPLVRDELNGALSGLGAILPASDYVSGKSVSTLKARLALDLVRRESSLD